MHAVRHVWGDGVRGRWLRRAICADVAKTAEAGVMLADARYLAGHARCSCPVLLIIQARSLDFWRVNTVRWLADRIWSTHRMPANGNTSPQECLLGLADDVAWRWRGGVEGVQIRDSPGMSYLLVGARAEVSPISTVLLTRRWHALWLESGVRGGRV